MNEKFSKKEAINFGWKIAKENFWFFVSVLLVVGGVSIVPDAAKFFGLKGAGIKIINYVVFAIGLILELGLIKICLKFYDQEKPKFDDLFSQHLLFFKIFFGSILYGLVIFFGLILFFIPGIIFAIRFYLFEYFIVDKGLGPIEALKSSWRITKGAGWNLFLFILLISAINFLGALAFVAGLLLTIPTTTLATIFVYRKLLEKSTNGEYVTNLRIN